MNETRVWKQLTQPANEKGIFRSPIYPARLGIRRRIRTLKPTSLKSRQLAFGLTLFFKVLAMRQNQVVDALPECEKQFVLMNIDRKSTRLNSSHLGISYAVFCLKKKKNI